VLHDSTVIPSAARNLSHAPRNTKHVDHIIREAREADKGPIVGIFNHFVRTSFAAYPDREVGLDFFDSLRNMAQGLPFLVVEVGPRVVGFGLMSRYHHSAAFHHTGVLTYFILPEYTRLGLGSALLGKLIHEAKARGMTVLLANGSSRNEQSLSFHRKHGFVECGRFKDIGAKFGERFDVVWMQKSL
jgi:L-amino acid N-acyltransferase YncA